VQPDFLKYLRPATEIAALDGKSLLADTRVNADGTPDMTRWSRPQADGPALCATVLARWLRDVPQLTPEAQHLAREVIKADLLFTLSWLPLPSFDIWEEESGEHYYTQLFQAEACAHGSRWLPEHGAELEAAARTTLDHLDCYWDPAQGFYRSRLAVSEGQRAKELDISVTLAHVHAGRCSGSHSVLDPKAHATISALEQHFESAYGINRELPPGRAPAMGRYPGDQYYSGGAYYFATLATAEFYYRLAAELAGGARLPACAENEGFRTRLGTRSTDGPLRLAECALQRADGFMRTVQAYTPADGSLSEQFDRNDGRQNSARHLAWSYAAFITAAAGRSRARHCLDLLRGSAVR
jgi:glucoamylase